MTQLITFDNQKFFVNHTLDELEVICGETFYRANRQYLINREVVAEALQYFARKLVLRLKVDGKHEIIISKSKVPEFLSWLRR
jgi:two-component system, LytTR family, response regulator LytT